MHECLTWHFESYLQRVVARAQCHWKLAGGPFVADQLPCCGVNVVCLGSLSKQVLTILHIFSVRFYYIFIKELGIPCLFKLVESCVPSARCKVNPVAHMQAGCSLGHPVGLPVSCLVFCSVEQQLQDSLLLWCGACPGVWQGELKYPLLTFCTLKVFLHCSFWKREAPHRGQIHEVFLFVFCIGVVFFSPPFKPYWWLISRGFEKALCWLPQPEKGFQRGSRSWCLRGKVFPSDGHLDACRRHKRPPITRLMVRTLLTLLAC